LRGDRWIKEDLSTDSSHSLEDRVAVDQSPSVVMPISGAEDHSTFGSIFFNGAHTDLAHVVDIDVTTASESLQFQILIISEVNRSLSHLPNRKETTNKGEREEEVGRSRERKTERELERERDRQRHRDRQTYHHNPHIMIFVSWVRVCFNSVWISRIHNHGSAWTNFIWKQRAHSISIPTKDPSGNTPEMTGGIVIVTDPVPGRAIASFPLSLAILLDSCTVFDLFLQRSDFLFGVVDPDVMLVETIVLI
jgi:hypothetical protein